MNKYFKGFSSSKDNGKGVNKNQNEYEPNYDLESDNGRYGNYFISFKIWATFNQSFLSSVQKTSVFTKFS